MKKMFQTLKRSGGTVLLLVAAALFTLGYSPVRANNIRILGKPQVVKDTATMSADIFFDIAWDNSWYLASPNNYDAAWIFVKCYNSTTSTWHHAYLDDTLGHYSIGSYDRTTMQPYDKNHNAAGTDPADSVIFGPVGRPQGSGYMVPHFGTQSNGEDEINAPMKLDPYHSEAKLRWGELDDQLDPITGAMLDPFTYLCVGFFLHRDTGALYKGFASGEKLTPGDEHYIKYYGAGDVVVPAIQLRWNYGLQGFTNSDDLGIKVFAVEMVYVPEGAFYLGGVGDQVRQPGSFTRGGSKFGQPFLVTGEEIEINVSETDPNGIWAFDSMQNGKRALEPGKIGELFPKGYAAFYIMRYELTQQAWCEFLNCLKTVQQNTRTDGDLNSKSIGEWTCDKYKPYGDDSRRWSSWACARNWVKIIDQPEDFVFGCDADNDEVYDELDTIVYNGWEYNFGYYHRAKGGTSGYIGSLGMDINVDGQDIAMNMVSFYDLLAYAEFAALRPMTELEYEKACRGPKFPAKNEFAWGDCHYKYFCQPFNKPQRTTPMVPTDFSNGNEAYCFGKTLNKGNEKVSGLYNCGVTKGMYYVNSSTSDYISVNVPAPLRVGCFADTSTTSRHHAGASYWGVMNMSDNVAEMCVSVVSDRVRCGTITGVGTGEIPNFTGTHGSGELKKEGEAQARGWGGNELLLQKNQAKLYYINRGAIFIPSKTVAGLYTNSSYVTTRNFMGVHDACRNWASDPSLDGPNSGQRPASDLVGAFYPIEAGMVSSRARWNHDVDLDVRNYIAFASSADEDLPRRFSENIMTKVPTYAKFPCMQGIRCVRSAADEHPYDATVAPCGK